LEKTSVPSTVTSKTPPEDFSSVTSAPGNDSRISAARLAARGSKFQTTQYSIDTHMATSSRFGCSRYRLAQAVVPRQSALDALAAEG